MPTLTSQGPRALKSSHALIGTLAAALVAAVVVAGGYISRGDATTALVMASLTFLFLGLSALAGYTLTAIGGASQRSKGVASYVVPALLVALFPVLLGGQPGVISLLGSLVYLLVAISLGWLIPRLRRA